MDLVFIIRIGDTEIMTCLEEIMDLFLKYFFQNDMYNSVCSSTLKTPLKSDIFTSYVRTILSVKLFCGIMADQWIYEKFMKNLKLGAIS